MGVTLKFKSTGKVYTSGSQSTAPVSAKSEVSSQRSEVSGKTTETKVQNAGNTGAKTVSSSDGKVTMRWKSDVSSQRSEVSGQKTGTETGTKTSTATTTTTPKDSGTSALLKLLTLGYTGNSQTQAQRVAAGKEIAAQVAENKAAKQPLKDYRADRRALTYTGNSMTNEQRNALASDVAARKQALLDSGTPVGLKATAGYLGRKALGGVAQAAEGIINSAGYLGQANARAIDVANMYRNSTAPVEETNAKATQYMNDARAEGLQRTAEFGSRYAEKTNEKYGNAQGLTKLAGTVTEGVAQMAPSIVMNMLAPGSSMIPLALQAAGNAIGEAKDAGASDANAVAYGTAVAAVEVLTEKMFDGMAGVFGKGAADDLVQNAIKKSVQNETAQNVLNKLAGQLGEGFEEWVSEYADYFINRLLVKSDERDLKNLSKDAMASFAIGALISGVMQAGGAGVGAALNKLTPQQAAETASDIVASQVRGDQRSEVSSQMSENAPAAQETQTGENNGLETRVEVQTENDAAETQGAVTEENAPVEQSTTRESVNAIVKDRNALLAMGIDPNGKTNSQLRAEVKAKLEAQDQRSEVRGQTTEAETSAPAEQVQSSEGRVQNEEAAPQSETVTQPQQPQEITPATVEAETAQEQQTETRTPEVRQPELVTETANDSNGMGAANAGFAYSRNALDAAENKYGTHEGGVNAVRPDNVPQKMDVVQRNEDGTVKTDDDGMAVTETMNVSESAKSFKGAAVTPEDFVPLIENKLMESKGKNSFLFTSITNDETTKAATNNIINDGWDKALANWRSDVAAGKHSDVITATGAILYNNAVNSGDYQLAADIMMDYTENVRGTSRALQATRILKTMPAEYRLYAIQSTVEKVNRATQEANEKTEAKRTKRGSKKRRVSEVEQAGRDAVGEAVKSTGTRYTNEPFVFEYDDAVGSAVANGIWQQQHPKAAKEKTFLQKIQSEIAAVANQNIKKQKQEAGKAGAEAVDYYANQDFYENAYQKAKEEVMRRYEEAGEEIPEEVKTFLDSTVGGTVTVDGILKDINTKISDLVKGGDEAMKNAETTIHDMLTDEYGFSEDDANKATAAIMAKIRGKVNPLVKAIEKKKALKAAEAKYGGEPFVFEYSDYIGETIANGIWKRKHAKPAEAPTFLRQLLSEISALANKNMKTEKTETGKSGAAAVDYYANQAFYDEAYQNAKDAILRQYEDAGENIPSDVLEFLDSDAYGTVGVEGILKDIGTKLTDIANGGDKALATAKSDIQYMLMQDYGFSQESAAEVTNAISYKLEEAVKTRANEILAQRFGEKEAGGKDAKAYVDKLATLVNLGAFKSSKYHDAAMDYVFGDKSIKLSDEALQAYAEAETDAEIDAALDGIVKEIADQLPSTLLDKWTSLRYVNMLGNLKTQGRNVIGNTVMQGLSRTRYKISAAMQDLVYVISRKKFERTMTVLPGKDRIKAARADAKLMDDYLLGEQKYQDRDNRTFDPTGVMRKAQDEKTVWKFGDNKLTRKLGIEGKTWFGYRTMQAIDDATDTAMSKGDVIFSRSSYTNALAGIMKAKGITAEQWTDEAWQTEHADLADECRAFAIKQAQEDTFRDDNAFSTWASKIGRRKDTPKAVRIAAEGTMPFRKTPANVLVRAEEYSPLGLINTAVDAVKAAKGDATGADIVDQFAKTLTGSVIYGLGFMLAKKGILRAGGDDDDKQKQFDELTGQQEYSIVLPNGTSYTIDWASPAAIPLFMGAELFEAIKDDGLQWTDIEGTITRITEPMLQMSMLQGVNDTLDDLKYSKNNLLQLAASSAVDYLTQGLTSSLIGQGERTTEKNRMSTYTDPEGNLPTWLQKMLGKASAKTPVWEYQQYEYIDQWGQKESNGDLLTRIVTNFISPGYVSKVEMSSLEKELQRLADKTGETTVFPSYADKSFTVDGKTIHLNMQQYERYATKKGQLSESIATKLTKSSVYKDLSDADKAAAISLCYQYANAKAKQSVSRYQPEGWLKTAIESGRDPAEYIADYVAYGSDYAGMDLSKLKKYGVTAETLYKADSNKNGVSQEELSKYLWGRSDLDDAARQIIWDSVGGWKTSYADYTKKNKK